jgi:hypothetical protein
MKKKLSRGDKVAVGGLLLAAVAAVAAVLVVPEFRSFFHLDKSQTAQAETKPTQSVTAPTPAVQAEPAKPEPSKPEKTRPSQKTTTRVSGSDNVAGNNVSGDHNVTGNNNQAGSTASAPNGIAITGGNVSNPTVNNITALPDLTMSDAQEKQIADSLDQTFAGVDVSIMEAQPNQNTKDFSEKLARILKANGANVQLSSASMYVPPAGMTLHKGMAITSFPPERRGTVDKFVNALGTAKVLPFVPIYEREDKKVNIVVSRSMDTPEEGKQY